MDQSESLIVKKLPLVFVTFIAVAMRVNASISEPFVLSTYGASQQLPKSGTGSKKQRASASVFATHENVSGSSDGYATVTAQADGIHILDISTLHPVISYTLGPSTSFSCPAIMRNTQQGADSICTTYAAINTSADITAEESGRTIWMWTENLSSRLEDRASQKKKSIVIQHDISGLFACDELPNRLLAQSPKGETTVLDTDLNVKCAWPMPGDSQNLLETFVYSRASCSFLPSLSTPPNGAILISVAASGDSTCVRTLSLNDHDQFLELGSSLMPVKPDQILNLSCSTSGHMSFLTRNGSWHSYLLESKDGSSMELTAISEPFRLTGLSFLSKPQSSEEVSLVSLSSSHVLLSALTASPNPEIVLLIWDLQYSVLLASQALPVPSTLVQAKDITIKLTLVPASTSQALLILSPNTSNSGRKSQASSSRSSVLIIPLTCPAVSTIANAMGQASAGAKWIQQATTSSSTAPTHDPVRSKVLATMRTAMEKNLPQAANVAFFEWEKRESKSAAKVALKEKTRISHAALSHAFVKDLLVTVLQPSKSANTLYSSEVVRYLLNQQLVSGSMVEGGLVAALRSKNDWQSICLALTNVIDLSETEIMECLHSVVVRHRLDERVASQDDGAMDVDSISDLPSLPSFLALCVGYTTTPPALRSAMRQYFKEAEDILAVLKVLETWLKQWAKRDVKLLPSKKDLSKNEHGVPVLREQEKDIHCDLPPLAKVLAFLQTLLDASFLTLLQYSPAHRALRSLHAQIEPEIVYIDDLEPLRGPLETFAKAHFKTVKEAGQDKRKKPLADWRQRRKQAHEQAGLSIGLYQLEELVL
ncbi:hypothetical protein D9615_000759 [Tricholomella constricta]|uniref:Uncharacterized protein n=1 Tax=Tricholomella constricta TaxID=117010 RepID=A0A8H5HQJ5_9AGAR|nr:hypothetical protein D9615_000759 [Tricholomella constricta]